MINTKKPMSIAGKIYRGSLFRLFFRMFFFNLLIILIALALWCVYFELKHFGMFEPYISRGFEFENLSSIKTAIQSASYVFYKTGSEEVKIFSGEFFTLLFIGLITLMVFQFFTFLKELFWGYRRAAKILQPLDEIAHTTQTLTEFKFDEEKVHNLESAIEDISPTRSDSLLSTEDKDLKGIENSINKLLERMRESYRQQARFVSDASHELRTPLAVIQGYANMLDRWGKDDEKILNEAITAIKSESSHMSGLIEQLLFLARGESGKTKLDFQKISLSAMIREVFDESEMIDKNHHKWNLSLPDNELFVTGDIAMLKQAARILVDNAMKYTQNGDFIELGVLKNDKGYNCFKVQDSGIGIPENDVSHVFERFFRSDPARSRASGGTGLGLAIAKWIIDKHGGYFEILSRENLGTRVTVCFKDE